MSKDLQFEILQQIGNQQDSDLVATLIREITIEVLRRYNWHTLEASGEIAVTSSTNTYTLPDDDIYVLLHAKTNDGLLNILDKKLFDIKYPDPSEITGDIPQFLIPEGKNTVKIYPACSATITYYFIKTGKVDDLLNYDEDFSNTITYGVLMRYFLGKGEMEKHREAKQLFFNHLERKVALYKPRQEEICEVVQDVWTRNLNTDRTSYRNEE